MLQSAIRQQKRFQAVYTHLVALRGAAAQSTHASLLNPCSTFNHPDATVITKVGELNIKFIVGPRRMKSSKQVKLCRGQYIAIKWYS